MNIKSEWDLGARPDLGVFLLYPSGDSKRTDTRGSLQELDRVLEAMPGYTNGAWAPTPYLITPRVGKSRSTSVPLIQEANVLRESFHEDLSHLRELRYGWDGESGEPPNDTSLYWTTLVIEKSEESGLKPVSIIPCPDDGVSILFSNEGRKAAIECFNTGEISAAITGSTKQIEAWDIAEDEEDVERAVGKISAFIG